jgi:Tol biopolymer transport system component
MKADAALNVGEILRDGVRLSTAEVVSILYEACRQIEAGVVRALPKNPDDLWITDAGTVTLTPSESVTSPRSAVASLLEVLLPRASDEPPYQVPASLRTLPDRLLASGAPTAGDYKDLIAILARYLPAESRQLLQQFVRRHAPGVAEDDLVALVAAPDETPEPEAIAVEAVVPAAPPPRVKRRSWPLAVAALLLLLASGYVGYQLSRSPEAVDDGTAATAAPRVIVMPPSTSPRPLSSAATITTQPLLLNAPDGAFSPSFGAGNALLFHTGRSDSGRLRATVIDAEGRPSKTALVFDDGARNYHPRLSPDGKRLAFDSDGDGERGVYVSRLDGGDRRRVSGDGYGAVPSWSPDGTRLAFIKADPAKPRVWNLWLLDLASGDLQRLSSFRKGQVWGASWFSNGDKVTYSHEDRLFIADLQAGTAVHFPSPVKGRLVRTPAVSPDGRRIIFQVFRDGVWMLDLPTGSMRRILEDPTAEEFAWEPGGRRIAYHSRRDGRWRIWMMTL